VVIKHAIKGKDLVLDLLGCGHDGSGEFLYGVVFGRIEYSVDGIPVSTRCLELRKGH
jgi:hypothetical protein